jgi:MerR family transcriptional regulator/heat shock protein HspR
MSSERDAHQYCSIEIAAEIVGLSRSRVRHLVRVGVVRPKVRERGRPLFGEDELARLRRIRRLMTELGVNLAGVEVILRLTDELAVLRAVDSSSST